MTKTEHDDLFVLAKTFIDRLADGSIRKSEAIAFLQNGAVASAPPVPLENQLKEWGDFLETTGCACDVSVIPVPRHRLGMDSLIVVPHEMTLNRVVELMRGKIDVWIHTDFGDDIDGSLHHNSRSNDHSYVVWTRDEVESDEEFRDTSAEEIESRGIPTVTLLERLLLGMFRLHKNEDHLDVIGGTLCAGTRTLTDKVPCVEWSDEDCQLRITVRSSRKGSLLTRARRIAC